MTNPDPKKILVVEDDPGIAELLKIAIEGEGYEVMICADGELALEQVQKYPPHLVLMDLWMPKMDGDQISRRLKGDLFTKDIPIILVSAQANLGDIARRIGADAFIHKPFDLDELLGTIRSNLNRN